MGRFSDWLKQHFVPHRGNNHRPHFLRGKYSRRFVVFILVCEFVIFVVPTLQLTGILGSNIASVIPSVLGSLTNKERTAQALPELVVNPLLTRAAELKAKDMAEKGYFAHTSPEGLTPWHWLKVVGYSYDYAGENLAINFTDSKDVTEAWMKSPGHRANIIKISYREVGTGIATGTYQGKETIFVAQVYANPRPLSLSSVVDTTMLAVVDDEKSVSGQVLGVEGNAVDSSFVLGAQEEMIPASSNTPAAAVTENKAKEPTALDKALASPRHTFNYFLFGAMAFILSVLILNIVIKLNVQHPDIITNGLAVVAIIGAVFIGNNYLVKSEVVSMSTSYVLEETI